MAYLAGKVMTALGRGYVCKGRIYLTFCCYQKRGLTDGTLEWAEFSCFVCLFVVVFHEGRSHLCLIVIEGEGEGKRKGR